MISWPHNLLSPSPQRQLRTLRPLCFFCHARKTLSWRPEKKDQVARIGGLLILAVPESRQVFSADPFMDISITADGFHENNHTNCSSAFRSSNYCSLKHVNTEAAEQTKKCWELFQNPKLVCPLSCIHCNCIIVIYESAHSVHGWTKYPNKTK